MVEKIRRDRANGCSRDRNSYHDEEKHRSRVPADDGKLSRPVCLRSDLEYLRILQTKAQVSTNRFENYILPEF